MWLVLLTLPWMPLLWSPFDAVGQAPADTAHGWGGRSTSVAATLVSAVLNAVPLGPVARARRRRSHAR
ncbi:SCO4225 family membrane protein [Streptomyces sp. NPDC001070]